MIFIKNMSPFGYRSHEYVIVMELKPHLVRYDLNKGCDVVEYL
jgi:hypothetical protein